MTKSAGGGSAESILAGVAIAALVVATFALRANWRANRLPWVFEFLMEYEKREPDRRYIVTRLAYQHRDTTKGIPNGDPGHSEFVSVAHYLNQLGFLVESGTVRLEDVAAIMGPSVLEMWRKLEPYVDGERKKRRGQPHRADAGYAEFFERLALRVGKVTPKAARDRLLHPDPCERVIDKVLGRRR